LLLCVAVCSVATAGETPKPAQPSTDDTLRESLDSHAGDDYDRALLGDAGKADAKAAGSKKDQEKRPEQELGTAARREDDHDDPLLKAAQGMREVQTRLAQGKSDEITQHVGRQVVADLEKFMDAMKKSSACAGQASGGRKPSGSAGSKPRSEAPSHAANDRPARESNPNAKHDSKHAWTDQELLAVQKMREQFISLQSRPHETVFERPAEYFLPEYEPEIEDYFRRLMAGKTSQERP